VEIWILLKFYHKEFGIVEDDSCYKILSNVDDNCNLGVELISFPSRELLYNNFYIFEGNVMLPTRGLYYSVGCIDGNCYLFFEYGNEKPIVIVGSLFVVSEKCSPTIVKGNDSTKIGCNISSGRLEGLNDEE
jgi:hypothetical protein